MNAWGQNDSMLLAADDPCLATLNAREARVQPRAESSADPLVRWGALTASTGMILVDLTQLGEAAREWPALQLQPLGIEQMYALLEGILNARRGERARAVPATRADLSALTPRQRDILRETVRGKSNSEIAQTLHISVETVKSHVRQILMRLHARNRTELAAMYQQSMGRVPARGRK